MEKESVKRKVLRKNPTPRKIVRIDIETSVHHPRALNFVVDSCDSGTKRETPAACSEQWNELSMYNNCCSLVSVSRPSTDARNASNNEELETRNRKRKRLEAETEPLLKRQKRSSRRKVEDDKEISKVDAKEPKRVKSSKDRSKKLDKCKQWNKTSLENTTKSSAIEIITDKIKNSKLFCDDVCKRKRKKLKRKVSTSDKKEKKNCEKSNSKQESSNDKNEKVKVVIGNILDKDETCGYVVIESAKHDVDTCLSKPGISTSILTSDLLTVADNAADILGLTDNSSLLGSSFLGTPVSADGTQYQLLSDQLNILNQQSLHVATHMYRRLTPRRKRGSNSPAMQSSRRTPAKYLKSPSKGSPRITPRRPCVMSPFIAKFLFTSPSGKKAKETVTPSAVKPSSPSKSKLKRKLYSEGTETELTSSSILENSSFTFLNDVLVSNEINGQSDYDNSGESTKKVSLSLADDISWSFEVSPEKQQQQQQSLLGRSIEGELNREEDGFLRLPAELENIDELLEEKSKKIKLTAKNVRSIIHQLITNEQVKEMVRNTLEEGSLKEKLQEAIFEPKMTRSKLKDVLQKGQILPPLLPPMKGLLSVDNAKSFLEMNFPEEEDDDEYHPSYEELEHFSDDESSHTSDCDSPSLSSYVTPRCAVTRRRSTSADDTTTPVTTPMGPPLSSLPLRSQTKQSKDQKTENETNIALRTRSKLPLNDTPLDEIEASFVAPDITPDLYYMEFKETHWTEFLASLTKDVTGSDVLDDELNDPEFDFIRELESLKEDEEESRNDRAVRVSKKELNELMDELFEDMEELNASWIEKKSPNAKRTTPNSKANSVEVSLSGSGTASNVVNKSSSSEMSDNQQEENDYRPTFSDAAYKYPGHLPPLKLNSPLVNVLVTELIKIKDDRLKKDETSKTEEEFFDDLPKLTDDELRQLKCQMRKHVQLLAQTFVQSWPTSNSDLESATDSTKQLLTQLKDLAENSIVSYNHSYFYTLNLDGAIEITQNSYDSKDINIAATVCKVMTEQVMCQRMFIQRGFSIEQMQIFYSSPVFIFPNLLPEHRMLSLDETERQIRVNFSTSEDNLLAMGVDQFGHLPNKYSLIRQFLLPTKTNNQLLYRYKNLRSSRSDPNNAVKFLCENKRLPEFPHFIEVEDECKIIPPNERKTRVHPKWFNAFETICHLLSKETSNRRISSQHGSQVNLKNLKKSMFRTSLRNSCDIFPRNINNILSQSSNVNNLHQETVIDKSSLLSNVDYQITSTSLFPSNVDYLSTNLASISTTMPLNVGYQSTSMSMLPSNVDYQSTSMLSSNVDNPSSSIFMLPSNVDYQSTNLTSMSTIPSNVDCQSTISMCTLPSDVDYHSVYPKDANITLCPEISSSEEHNGLNSCIERSATPIEVEQQTTSCDDDLYSILLPSSTMTDTMNKFSSFNFSNDATNRSNAIVVSAFKHSNVVDSNTTSSFVISPETLISSSSAEQMIILTEGQLKQLGIIISQQTSDLLSSSEVEKCRSMSKGYPSSSDVEDPASKSCDHMSESRDHMSESHDHMSESHDHMSELRDHMSESHDHVSTGKTSDGLNASDLIRLAFCSANEISIDQLNDLSTDQESRRSDLERKVREREERDKAESHANESSSDVEEDEFNGNQVKGSDSLISIGFSSCIDIGIVGDDNSVNETMNDGAASKLDTPSKLYNHPHAFNDDSNSTGVNCSTIEPMTSADLNSTSLITHTTKPLSISATSHFNNTDIPVSNELSSQTQFHSLTTASPSRPKCKTLHNRFILPNPNPPSSAVRPQTVSPFIIKPTPRKESEKKRSLKKIAPKKTREMVFSPVKIIDVLKETKMKKKCKKGRLRTGKDVDNSLRIQPILPKPDRQEHRTRTDGIKLELTGGKNGETEKGRDSQNEDDLDEDLPLRSHSQKVQQKTNKAEEKRGLELAMLSNDLLSTDQLRVKREAMFANAYHCKVKKTLVNNQELYARFLHHLSEFGQRNTTVNQLYRQLKILFCDYPDLITDFAGFLSPEQAVECGCFMTHYQFTRARIFMRKLEMYFHRHPSHLQKCLKAFNAWQDKKLIDHELFAAVMPLIRTSPHLVDEFTMFFDDKRPPQSRFTHYEEVTLGSNFDETDLDDYEKVDFPNKDDNNYGTVDCRCRCHVNQSDERFMKKLQHCTSCGLKVIKGQLFLQTSDRILRPAIVIYHHHSKDEKKERTNNKCKKTTLKRKKLSSKKSIQPQKQNTVVMEADSTSMDGDDEEKRNDELRRNVEDEEMKKLEKLRDCCIEMEKGGNASVEEERKIEELDAFYSTSEIHCIDESGTDFAKKMESEKETSEIIRGRSSIGEDETECDIWRRQAESERQPIRDAETEVIIDSMNDVDELRKENESKRNLNPSNELQEKQNDSNRKTHLKNNRLSRIESNEDELHECESRDNEELMEDGFKINEERVMLETVVSSRNHPDTESSLSAIATLQSLDVIQKWSRDEDKLILETYIETGSKKRTCQMISSSLTTRSSDEICQRLDYLLRMYSEMNEESDVSATDSDSDTS